MKKVESPVSLSQLVQHYQTANTEYSPIFKKFRVLDAVDRSRLWQTLGAKFPAYQILPDTNFVSYIKSNLVASIYTVAKSAQLLATSEDDQEAVENINIALDYIWDTRNVAHYQLQAGASAALFNVGITQVGWNPNISDQKSKYYQGNVVLKNIHPTKFMRDPYAESLDNASFCVTWESYHKSVLLSNEKYKKPFENYLHARNNVDSSTEGPSLAYDRADPKRNTEYHTVYIYFVRHGGGKIAEVHVVDNAEILWVNEDIKPSCFPFVELFCNLPEGDVVGTSECSKILSNNIAYNILNSMMLTAEYKNQRPPRFISSNSGLNVRNFTQHGNEADRTFVVNGDASRAVHYHQFPVASAAGVNLQMGLMQNIQMTSGIDGRYTGRDTGSILTTGGMEDMLSRVTLVDMPKILNYEKYTKDLTELILMNFVTFSMKRKYFKKDDATGKYTAHEVDYSSIAEDTVFHYAVHISSELPKNKQRIATMASMLMEKQMQYGATQQGPELITPEEWLSMQDLPFKERMFKRMNIQRLGDVTADVAETLFNYAGLVKDGMMPEDAISAIAQNKMAAQQGKPPLIEIPPIEDSAPQMDVNPLMFEDDEPLPMM